MNLKDKFVCECGKDYFGKLCESEGMRMLGSFHTKHQRKLRYAQEWSYNPILEQVHCFQWTWTSGDTCPGFQSQGGSLACFLACAQWIPQIHLWCDTY